MSVLLVLLRSFYCVCFALLLGAVLSAHTESYDRDFGIVVEAFGDVDSDGVSELAIGDPRTSRGENGCVWVLSGATRKLLYRVEADSAGFGESIAGGFDINEDGAADFVVAFAGSNGEGGVAAINGRDGSELWRMKDEVLLHNPGSVVLSESGEGRDVRALQHLTMKGPAIAGVSDVDGDGVRDFVGAFAGRAGSARSFFVCISAKKGAVVWTRTTAFYIGFSIASGSDLNADGVGDVLLGAPVWGDSRQGIDSGRVLAISVRNGEVLWTTEGPGSERSYGASVAFFSDLDRDGIDEYAVGLGNEDKLESRVFVGSGRTGKIDLQLSLDEIDSSSESRVLGSKQSNAHGLGHSVLDVNGTLVISSVGRFAEPFLFSSDGRKPLSVASQAGSTGSGSGFFWVGDLTRDGVDEVAISAIDQMAPYDSWVCILSRDKDGLYTFGDGADQVIYKDDLLLQERIGD